MSGWLARSVYDQGVQVHALPKELAERMEGSVNVLLIEQVPELRVYRKTSLNLRALRISPLDWAISVELTAWGCSRTLVP